MQHVILALLASLEESTNHIQLAHLDWTGRNTVLHVIGYERWRQRQCTMCQRQNQSEYTVTSLNQTQPM